MNNTDNSDLLATFKTLAAENKSYESRLDEYARIIDSRDTEIQMLQSMLSEGNEYRSNLDEQVKELRDLKGGIIELQRQAINSNYMVTGKQLRAADNVSLEAQFENLKQDYAFLQSQLADLQSQLLEVNSRNILLMLQTARMAELESLLANFEQSNDATGS